MIGSITQEVIFHGRQRNECWFEPSAALVPAGRNGAVPQVMVTTAQLTGCDMGPHHYTWTQDFGQRWSNPAESQGLQVNPVDGDLFEKPWVSPFYHAGSDTVLMIGRTCFSQDLLPTSQIKGEMHALWHPRNRGRNLVYDLIYSRWEPELGDCVPWQRIAWQHLFDQPEGLALFTSDVCERVELADGSILSPSTLRGADKVGQTVVVRLQWDGETLSAVERGNVLRCGDERGLHEPSIVRFGDRYYLTIRNDLRGYVAQSDDGLRFSDPQPWCFDDGEELGSYNTQQHWLAFGGALHLVYTRRSELSNGVVRSRAPLYIAEVDPERCCVLRDTERVVIPENGARMGNFCTLNVTPDEAWVITGEWLQQRIPGYTKDMPFFADADRGASAYNRIQYIGDLLLARLRA
jgi:hypothetical protein